MTFIKHNLPDPVTYFKDMLGQKIVGGRTKDFRTACGIHGGKNLNLSVSTQSGCFYCFKCGASGGDILSYHMQTTGDDFVSACKALGAWLEDATPVQQHAPTPITPRQALEVLAFESLLVCMELSRIRRGEIQTEYEALRVCKAAGRIGAIYRSFQQ